MSGSLKPPSELNFSKSRELWPEWKKRFMRYSSASGLTEKSARRQVDMLIYCMGEEAEAISTQITVRDPTEHENADVTLLARTIEAFDNYFNPRSSHLHYEVLFGSRVQQVGESNEQFIRNLHELAMKCSWDENHRNNMLRSRLLAGMLDKDLSRELQVDPDVTLETIKQQLRTTKEIIISNQKAELDGHQQVFAVQRSRRHLNHHSSRTAGQSHSTPKPQHMHHHHSNNVKYNSSTNVSISDCTYCGGTHVKGSKRVGHFGKVCQSRHIETKSSSDSSSHRDRHVREVQIASCSSDEGTDVFNVNSVNDTKCDVATEVFHVNDSNVKDFSIHGTSSNVSDKWLIVVRVNGKPLRVQVDTGAEVSLVSKETFLDLGGTKVVKSKARLAGYSGHDIPILGRAKLDVTRRSVSNHHILCYH